MRGAADLLKKRARWLLTPANFASTPIGIGSVYYTLATMELPPEAKIPLLVIIALLMGVLIGVATLVYDRALKTLAGLGKGALPPTAEHLVAAAREVHRLPDFVFRMNAYMWTGAVAFLLGALKLWLPDFPVETLGRMAVSGLAFFPLGACLAYLLTARRTRAVLRLLVEAGLPTEGLAAVVPRGGSSVRRRIVVLSAVLVLTPSAIIADLSVAVLRRGMERVEKELDPARQIVLAEQAIGDARKAVAILGGAAFLLGMLTAWLAATSVTSPLRELTAEARRVEAGDLRGRPVVPAEDEVWSVSTAFSEMRAQLATALTELRGAGLRLSGTAEQLSAMTTTHTQGATAQAGAIEQTSAGTEELAEVARQIASTAGEVAAKAEETFVGARASQGSAEAFVGAMTELENDHREIAEAAEQLRESADHIRYGVKLIAATGERADFLALSADLEGTKAGEVGRAFSLVAAEMRRLGHDILRSTREIDVLIEEVRDATAHSVAATETGRATIVTAAGLGRQVIDDLKSILNHARITSVSASAISQATSTQQGSAGLLAEGMARILAIAHESGAVTANLSESTAQIASVSRDLKRVVEAFQTEEA